MGNLAHRLGPLPDCCEAERIRAGARGAIHQVDVRIEGVKNLAPADCGCDARVAPVAVEARVRQVRSVPQGFDPGVRREI